MGKINIKTIKKLNPKLEKDISKLVVQLSEHAQTKQVSDWITEIINYPNSSFIIAFNDKGKAIGMVVLMIYPLIEGYRKGWLEGMVIDENYRRQGIGEKIMKKAIDESKINGLRSLNLTSRPERLAANKLYKKSGFKKVETNVYRINF